METSRCWYPSAVSKLAVEQYLFMNDSHCLFCIQDCPDPSDVPKHVEPDISKLDLQHFFQDLQKYKPWLSTAAWEAWEDFTATSADLSSPSVYLHWGLPDLVSAAITAAHARSQDASSLCTETTRILEKETAVPAKVFMRVVYVMWHGSDVQSYTSGA